MTIGPNRGGVGAEMRQEARKHATNRNRIDPHARAHGQPDMARARRQYERDNPSRMRFLWRAWDFLFGLGRTRMPR